jgi:hypothetical protein
MSYMEGYLRDATLGAGCGLRLRGRPVTSPRLRGEVGVRALGRGVRVRGNAELPNGEYLYDPARGPSPHASPRKRGEGEFGDSGRANDANR